ncbi:hypothetical protein GCM10011428_84330 [Streptomyces violaceus]
MPEASTIGSERRAGRCRSPPSSTGMRRAARTAVAGLRPAAGALRPARHGQSAAGPYQVAEGQAVAGTEGLAGALAVIGQHDDPVRARGVLGDVLDQGERPVEAFEDLLRVAARRAGVVGDLVVGHQVGVDGGAADEHVAS